MPCIRVARTIELSPEGGGGGWLELRAEIVNGKLPGKLSVGLWDCTGVTICGVSRAKLTGLNFKLWMTLLHLHILYLNL